jgi:hypothetical protein
MSKPATQSSDGSETSNSNLDVCFHFHAIDDVEHSYRYGPGGYHPVAIGDQLGGYHCVLHKLGHGNYSAVWLARDETLQRLVATKVCTTAPWGEARYQLFSTHLASMVPMAPIHAWSLMLHGAA